MNLTEKITSVLLGVAIGDALGVPVEFKRREELKENPVKDMSGFGTHYQPPGTFSDDSSLTFCLAEALTQDFDSEIIGRNFFKWAYGNFWTAHGKVFDIGITTRLAIENIANGTQPEVAGPADERSNGNGSLMRIAPLVFYLTNKPAQERFEITRQVSSITHGHIRSVIACCIYLEFALGLVEGKNKFEVYHDLQKTFPDLPGISSAPTSEIALFNRILEGDISQLTEHEIQSSGYVLHTLEAAIWCLLTSSTYEETVLKAVNLGEDTDTTGAVAGGLAGLLYGRNNIPKRWIATLAKHEEIMDLANRLGEKLSG